MREAVSGGDPLPLVSTKIHENTEREGGKDREE
jgi:hypothetical protein